MLVPEAQLSAERLDAEVERLRRDPDALAAMAGRARALGEAHRSDALPALIDEVAGVPTGGSRPS